MKTLIIFLALTFSVMFSSSSYAEWKWVSESVKGNNFYVDYERIRKVDGFVYYWYLTDYLKPDKDGDLSEKSYIQGDCKLFRFKILSGSFHKEPMGGGSPKNVTPKNPQWGFPSPNSVNEIILKEVCNQ